MAGAALGAASCKDRGVNLSVDLRTDYVAAREFGGVVTEVTPSGQRAERAVASAESFVEGARVADFGDVPTGSVLVKVKVLAPDGQPMLERLARVSVTADFALTLVVTRSCEGVVCPEPGGDRGLETCDRGRCVRAECTPATPQYCAEPECRFDADCTSDVACVAGRCVGGTCLFLPSDAKCAPTQTCSATEGCTPPLGPTCTPSGTTETRCDDGVDDDCDGRIDCDDPDCDKRPCEDGDRCTEGETCQEAACVGGTPKSCDDKNACTDDACDPKTGCTHANNAVPCDDGVYCNGADSCSGGACAAHAGDPCAKGCDEAANKCLACSADADCGPVTYGAWSACAGFASTCATTGTQSRTVTTPKCVGGACQSSTLTQTQACTRPTDGVWCRAATYGTWGACGGFASACDTTGTRRRTKTTYACASGACAPTTVTETGTCSRSVSNGTSCGTGKYCCGGTCYAKNNPNHCSSCGIKCSSGTCASLGSGRYSCTCSSNAQCRSDGFGPDATCYAPTGGAMYCNCQCTGKGCCAGGASCTIISGNNYCSY